jgi:predicted ferric reductase
MTIKATVLIPVTVLVHAALWAIAVQLHPVPLDPWSVVGEFFSTWAVTLLAFNLLLASRARWVERLFGGLDKMYVVHRSTGIFATLLLVVHVVVVPKAEDFSVGKPLGILALVAILIGVFLAVLPRTPLGKKIKLPYQKWRLSHRAMGLFFTVGAVHALMVPSLFSQLPIVRTYVAMAMAVAVGSWIYRVFLFSLFRRPKAYEVSATRSLNDRVTEVKLSARGDGIAHKPGQFVFLSFDGDDLSEPHPFTIASHPEGSELRFAIKALGDYTSQLKAALKPSAKARVEGPYGCFDHRQGNRRQLWLAGGIGITPFLSFLADVDDDREVTLVWSVNEAAEAFQHDEIEALAEGRPSVSYLRHVVASDGYLQLSERHMGGAPRACSVYICGPEAMRDSFIRQLVKLGVSRQDIHFEEFSFR